MRTIAHFKSDFLYPSETFIRLQMDAMPALRHLGLCRRHIENAVSSGIEWLPVPKVDELVMRVAGEMPSSSRALRRHGVGLLHAHFGKDGWTATHLAGRGRRVPLVVSFYGRDASAVPRIEKWQRRYKELFERADLILALSGHMKNLLESLGCPTEKILIHNFGINVDAMQFVSRRLPADGVIRLLFVGRFVPKKGIHIAIESLQRLPRCVLDIVGDGPLLESYRSLAAGLDLAGRVRFNGWLDSNGIRRAMERAHVLVAPSVTGADGDMEGTPTVIFEAMASGLPVAASMHAGIPEQLGWGECGAVFPEGSCIGLAGAVKSLVSTQAAFDALASAARMRVEQYYDSKKQGAGLQNHYELLMPESLGRN